MQHIVVVVHCVVLAGPQIIELPDPLQQYGEPELQTLLEMGFWGEQLEELLAGVVVDLRGGQLGMGLRTSRSRYGDASTLESSKGIAMIGVKSGVTARSTEVS
jgi:hypothetical protein